MKKQICTYVGMNIQRMKRCDDSLSLLVIKDRTLGAIAYAQISHEINAHEAVKLEAELLNAFMDVLQSI